MHTFKSFLTEASKLQDQQIDEMELRGINVKSSKNHPGKTLVDNPSHPQRNPKRTSDATSVKNFLKQIQNHKGKRGKLYSEQQLDELKTSTLGNYVVTAAGDLRHQSALLQQYKKDYPGNNSPTEQKLVDQKARAVKKRSTGIGQATNRLVNRIYGHSKGKDN